MPDPVLTPAQREALRVLYGGAEIHYRYLPCGRRGVEILAESGLAKGDGGWFRIP